MILAAKIVGTRLVGNGYQLAGVGFRIVALILGRTAELTFGFTFLST